jgi:hypothetical protein
MKIHHATALAVVGWYLMVPPNRSLKKAHCIFTSQMETLLSGSGR